MARSDSTYRIIPGPEIHEWASKFDDLPSKMAEKAMPIFQEEVASVFRASQALVHEYPRGAAWFSGQKLSKRDVLAAGRLKRSGFHFPALRTNYGELETRIEYTADFSEWERLGTRHSHPPVLGDNIPRVTEHASPQHATHDFMRPWWPGMDDIDRRMPEIWEEIWR